MLYLALSSQHSLWECWWQEPAQPGLPPDPQQRKAHPLSVAGMAWHLAHHTHKQPKKKKSKYTFKKCKYKKTCHFTKAEIITTFCMTFYSFTTWP